MQKLWQIMVQIGDSFQRLGLSLGSSLYIEVALELFLIGC